MFFFFYASCSRLSVCPSVAYELNSKTKLVNRNSWCANFQLKRSTVNGHGTSKTPTNVLAFNQLVLSTWSCTIFLLLVLSSNHVSVLSSWFRDINSGLLIECLHNGQYLGLTFIRFSANGIITANVLDMFDNIAVSSARDERFFGLNDVIIVIQVSHACL